MARVIVIALAVALAAGFARSDSGADGSEAQRIAGLALDRMLASHSRVISIHDRVRIAAAPYCGNDVGAVLGMLTATDKTFREIVPGDENYEVSLQRAATQRFALEARPRVVVAPAGLPAATAGIKVGDVILEIDGEPLDKRTRLLALRRKDPDAPIRIAIEREGSRVELVVPPSIGCALPGQSRFGNSINAFATRWGSYTGIYVLYGMLDFVPSDDQLAVVIGHELSHLILDPGSMRGGTRRTEAEADYLGLYLAARAGFDISEAPDVWRRLGRSNPFSTIDWGAYAHPTSAARMKQLEATLAEIDARGGGGPTLEGPELKAVLDRPAVDEAALAEATSRMRLESGAELQAERDRLLRVSYRLRTRSVALCSDETAPVLGASIGRRRDVLSGKHREEAKEIFGLGDEPQVLAVLPDAPGFAAGLVTSDVLVRVNGASIRKTNDAFAALREHREAPPLLTISRGGAEREIELTRVVGCQQEAMLVMSSSFHTRSDRNAEELLVPKGLLTFARSDDELAFAIAHQLAHSLQNSTQARSEQDEVEADRLALEVVAAAGYTPEVAPAFLERMATYEPELLVDNDEDPSRYSPYPASHAHGSVAARVPALRALLAARQPGVEVPAD